jgi:hypothetical protein
MLLDNPYARLRTFDGQDYSTKATAGEGSGVLACDGVWPLVGCWLAEYNRTTAERSGARGGL